MSDATNPRDRAIPPIKTIPEDKRVPPRTTPKATPARTRDGLPDGVTAVGFIGGIIIAALALAWVVPKAIDWSNGQDWSWFTQWAATISNPIHAYLQSHTTGLPLTASTVLVIWQGTGLGSLILAWLTGAVGARLTWIAHGAATAWMVWDSSPAAGRPVAAALAVLAWTIGSLFALRGLSLRPVIITRSS